MAARFQPVEKHRRTMDGIVFASMKEMRRYQELKLLERARKIHDLRCQPSFKVEINGFPFCRYTADFQYLDETGLVVFEEVKSTGTAKDAAYRLRKKAFELAYGFTVTEVIMR